MRRPELRGLPVVVAGTGPRAVVTTASYEARKFGVFSATPAERARRLCPQAVFIPPDHTAYRETSARVMEVLREHVERVEVVGLDEAYLDLTGIERPKAAARRVKAAVFERTGLVCSIGIGPNKLVAKVASDAEKPNGFVVLSREQACERFAAASAGPDPGHRPADRRAARRARDPHARRAGRRARGGADRDVRPAVGPVPARARPLRGRARGHDPPRDRRASRARRPSTTTCAGIDALQPVLDRLAGELCETLVKRSHRGRTIGIKVRLNDFSTHTRARTIDAPTNDVDTVRRVATELLREFDPPKPVRLIGVRVAGLDEPHGERAPASSPGQLELAL